MGVKLKTCRNGHDRTNSANLRSNGRCKLCWEESSVQYRKVNEGAMRLYFKFRNILRKYGLTQEGYEVKLKRQEHRCEICRKLMIEPGVDHDHETKQVRDLLCKTCNAAVGYVKEDILIAERLVGYLQKWKS